MDLDVIDPRLLIDVQGGCDCSCVRWMYIAYMGIGSNYPSFLQGLPPFYHYGEVQDAGKCREACDSIGDYVFYRCL